MRLEIGDVALPGLVDVIREIIGVKAEEKQLECVCEIASDVPAACVPTATAAAGAVQPARERRQIHRSGQGKPAGHADASRPLYGSTCTTLESAFLRTSWERSSNPSSRSVVQSAAPRAPGSGLQSAGSS